LDGKDFSKVYFVTVGGVPTETEKSDWTVVNSAEASRSTFKEGEKGEAAGKDQSVV